MSAEDDSKTEQPTPRKLEQARREGQVAVGRDLVAMAAVGFCGAALFIANGPLGEALRQSITVAAGSLHQPSQAAMVSALKPVGALALACLAAAFVGGLVGAVAQTGGGFWTKLATPDPSRLFQKGKLKRFINGEVAVDTLLAAVKVVAVGAVTWSALSDTFLTVEPLLRANVATQTSELGRTLFGAFGRIVLVLLATAGLDFALTRYRLRKKLMMTKDEIRREVKEDEGDPQIRGRRRRKHRELARGNVAQDVPKADALVVNPTHVAVAIRYRRDESAAPRVISKGKGAVADKMREIARTEGIPIVENIPLARLLYRRVKIGGEVPAETFKAVAAVLAFVYRITGRNNAGSNEANP